MSDQTDQSSDPTEDLRQRSDLTPAEERLLDAVEVAGLTGDDVVVDFNAGRPDWERQAWARLLKGEIDWDSYLAICQSKDDRRMTG